MYVGTYTEPKPWAKEASGHGLIRLELDLGSGILEMVDTYGGIADPSYFTYSEDRRSLYAITEAGSDAEAVAFAVGREGNLAETWRVRTGAASPCHVAIGGDDDDLLMVSHYNGHRFSVIPFGKNGPTGAPVVLNPALADLGDLREARPHSALRLPTTRLVAIADTGRDCIVFYRVTNEVGGGGISCTLEWKVRMPVGCAPRHLAIHPTLKTLYVSNQGNATVGVLRSEDCGWSGRVEHCQTAATVAEEWGRGVHPAEILVHPAGRYVYVANRGYDSLAVLEVIDSVGRLAMCDVVPTPGQNPRHFSVTRDGRLGLIGFQDSNRVESFVVDDNGRHVTWTGGGVCVGTPVCVRPLEAPVGPAASAG